MADRYNLPCCMMIWPDWYVYLESFLHVQVHRCNVFPTVWEMVSVHHQDVVAACFGIIVTQGEWTEIFTPFGCEVPIAPVDIPLLQLFLCQSSKLVKSVHSVVEKVTSMAPCSYTTQEQIEREIEVTFDSSSAAV